MRITRSLVLFLGCLPAPLAAQVASTRGTVVHIPDLSWLAPTIAAATGQASVALAQARPALAQLGPTLTVARSRMIRAQAALTATGARLSRAGDQWIQAWDWDQGIADTPPTPWAQQDPADQLYRDARAALNRERFSTAADLFAQIYTKYPRSSYAGDAYYWQAYALSRRSGDEALRKALDVLRLQEQKAPNASTRRDAETLATRIQGQLAQGGNEEAAAVIAATASAAATVSASASPSASTIVRTRQSRNRDRCGDEDDVQTAALNALQNMDEDRALPILKKVLARRDAESVCLRRKAMFIVSQHEGAETERILLEAARSDPDGEVREQAVFWLSQVDSPSAVSALDSILRSATDPVLQEKAIFALSQQDSPKARQALRDFALRSGASEDLREKAIFWIGQGDDPDRLDFLKTLYGQLKSEALREKILFSISQIDDRASSQWLLSIAGDVNAEIELRKKALFWVGQSDYPLSELATLYERMPSREMKEQLIFVYSQRSEKAAVDRLMQIAKTETDRELRKKAIFWLGQMNDPRVPEFLASLLEKP
ncbi:MAG TPA: HEAT repeat domain-containing protein [Gemmatimonadales bacterium]|jgi:HEAT repeat protein|nr:HEAT repeat domain-containing protein [Gemmatimonadales bacterium]